MHVHICTYVAIVFVRSSCHWSVSAFRLKNTFLFVFLPLQQVEQYRLNHMFTWMIKRKGTKGKIEQYLFHANISRKRLHVTLLTNTHGNCYIREVAVLSRNALQERKETSCWHPMQHPNSTLIVQLWDPPHSCQVTLQSEVWMQM